MSQSQTRTLTEDEWAEKYKPVANRLSTNASWEGWDEQDPDTGVLFETYGEEQEYVFGLDNHFVWTLKEDDDGHPYITNGYKVVNRLGFFVCRTPWKEVDTPCVVVLEENNE